MHNGVSFASKINRYVDEDMDLGTLIKPRLQHEADVATKLLHIGAKCITIKKNARRPSALEILEKFEDI